MSAPTADSVRSEVRAWLAENWDETLSVSEWWSRLALSGYAAPTFPVEDFGKGYHRGLANIVSEELANAGAIGPPAGLGYLLTAPTIVAHGTREQKDDWLLRILDGRDAWCQLFSEPGAGSDLAGMQCKATKDGDEWIIEGQKVWTSTAQLTNLGMLLARTDPDAPKHAGITYFRFEMDQPGVTIRPLREMTGRALFNEVFIDGARVRDADILGGLNNGWAVANTTLAAERAGPGSGGSGAAGGAFPGPISGNLETPVTKHLGQTRGGGGGGGGGGRGGLAGQLIGIAKEKSKNSDTVVRQGLAQLWILQQIGRYTSLRMRGRGVSIGLPNVAKLMMSEMLRLHRDVATSIMGPDMMLYGDDAPTDGVVQEQVLFSPGPAIYGGTDQVQRNIIGERALGLPKEPDPFKGKPFKETPKNA
ncbi:MAG: acyl-CoA dehydrogenase family protein [Actinomycetes bacterium]